MTSSDFVFVIDFLRFLSLRRFSFPWVLFLPHFSTISWYYHGRAFVDKKTSRPSSIIRFISVSNFGAFFVFLSTDRITISSLFLYCLQPVKSPVAFVVYHHDCAHGQSRGRGIFYAISTELFHCLFRLR